MPSSTRHTSDTSDDTSATAKKSDDQPFYCPGCGARYGYQQRCTGKPESPHQPIEVVSTDELSGDSDKFTPAPDTTNLG